MSWEDDELIAVEKLKQEKARRDDLILQRSRQRESQARYCWIDLQGKLRGLVVTFNAKADRTIFEVQEGAASQIAICHEDGWSLDVEYDSSMYRASFRFLPYPAHNQDFELVVMPVAGNDATVWVDEKTRTRELAEAIATRAIRKLLRSGL